MKKLNVILPMIACAMAIAIPAFAAPLPINWVTGTTGNYR